MTNPEALLTTRGNTHGEFRDNSKTSQQLKSTMKLGANWANLTAYQKEGLEMIMHKIGRILSGDPMFLDHWEDITGYAKLIADRVKEDIA